MCTNGSMKSIKYLKMSNIYIKIEIRARSRERKDSRTEKFFSSKLFRNEGIWR